MKARREEERKNLMSSLNPEELKRAKAYSRLLHGKSGVNPRRKSSEKITSKASGAFVANVNPKGSETKPKKTYVKITVHLYIEEEIVGRR